MGTAIFGTGPHTRLRSDRQRASSRVARHRTLCRSDGQHAAPGAPYPCDSALLGLVAAGAGALRLGAGKRSSEPVRSSPSGRRTGRSAVRLNVRVRKLPQRPDDGTRFHSWRSPDARASALPFGPCGLARFLHHLASGFARRPNRQADWAVDPCRNALGAHLVILASREHGRAAALPQCGRPGRAARRDTGPGGVREPRHAL